MDIWKKALPYFLGFIFLVSLSILTHSLNDKMELSRIIIAAQEIEIKELTDQVTELTTTDGYVLPESGKLIFPFYPNSEIRITSHFHLRGDPFQQNVGPINIEDKLHHGLDLAPKSGVKIVSGKQTIIRATVSGYVTEHFPPPNGYWRGDGNNGSKIVIRDANGFDHIFLHFSETYVSSRPGENFVEAGDEIGRMGDTGKTTGPHLHYEIRKGEEATGYTWYDPMDYFDIRINDEGYVLFPEDIVNDRLTISSE